MSGLEKSRFMALQSLLIRKQSAFDDGNKCKQKPEVESHRWIIHPQSHLRHCYLVFMVILTFVNLITIPLDIAFSEDMHDSAHKYWVAFNVFSDVLFCLDVGLNFRFGVFSENGEAILDPKLIAEEYFRTWFVPDVVAAFPVDIIIIILEQNYKGDTSSLLATKMVRVLMFARILSLIRLLRVPRLMRFCVELESVSDIQLEAIKKAVRVFFLLLMMVLIWHWNSCIQYFINVIEEFPQDCWIVQQNLQNTSIGEKYSYASFRAFSQMAWRSSESIELSTRLEERWMAVVNMVIGYCMCLTFIACLISAVGSLTATGNAYKKKINQIKYSSLFKKLPRNLRQRTIAQYKWHLDKNIILSALSKRLRKDIMAELCSNLLKKSRVFLRTDREFSESVLLRLEFEFFKEGDVIVHQNAGADHMFFIEEGRVLLKNECLQMELCDGDHFGEISFLFGGKQLATVSALTTCSVYALSLREFRELEEQFPRAVEELRAAALRLKLDLEGHELEVQVASTSNTE